MEFNKFVYEKDIYAPACNGMKVEMTDSKTRITGRAWKTEATCTINGVGEMSVDFYVDKVEDLTKNNVCPRDRNFFQEYYDKKYTSNGLKAKKVIFNPPATIIL